MTEADKIRHYVLTSIIQPARQRGDVLVTIRASDVHKAMGLSNHLPNVCQVLDGDKFQQYARVHLVSRSGPLHGSTTVWVFGIR